MALELSALRLLVACVGQGTITDPDAVVSRPDPSPIGSTLPRNAFTPTRTAA